ncbi:MAG TPA: hypothetical protein VLE53_15695 [Gemmatimonadaceae bacterium]|nr:hypothetical protein [Gemmatimonadaceae bacterium]
MTFAIRPFRLHHMASARARVAWISLHRGRSAFFASVLAVVAGCQGSRQPATVFSHEPPVEMPFAQGLFFYEATALNQKLTGRIIIADTLVLLEPDDDNCRRPPTTVATRRDKDLREFYCDGAATASGVTTPYGTTRIIVNLHQPTRNSQWGRLTLRPLGNKQTCTQTVTDAAGRTSCQNWVTRPAFDYGWVWGRLHVKRGSLLPADTTQSIR